MNSLSLKYGLLIAIVSMGLWAAPLVKAQEILNAADSARIGHIFDRDDSPDLLDCSIQPRKPILNDLSRFIMMYGARCSMAQFGGRTFTLLLFARVTPDGGKPVLLARTFRYRAIPVSTEAGPKQLNAEMMGEVAVGEGQYQVEVLVKDQRTGRTAMKIWRTSIPRLSAPLFAELAVPPHSVIPVAIRTLPFKMDTSGKGLRVTVLLNVAPSDPASSIASANGHPRLPRPVLLTKELRVMLRQMPGASVRLRAFNLDQQRELFRQDQFDEAGFVKLHDSLRALERGTVSVRTLQHPTGGLEMIVDYANKELSAAIPPDAIILLGPQTAYGGKIPPEIFKGRGTANPHLYYFEYVRSGGTPEPNGGAETRWPSTDTTGTAWAAGNAGVFPTGIPITPSPLVGPPEIGPVTFGCRYYDAVCVVTQRLGGTVYPFFSADDLVRSIKKMMTRLQPAANSPAISHGQAQPAPTP